MKPRRLLALSIPVALLAAAIVLVRAVPAKKRPGLKSPEGANTPQTGASEAQPPAPHSIPTSPEGAADPWPVPS